MSKLIQVIEVKGYKKVCDICGREVIGKATSEVEYNFKLHYQACKKIQKEKEDSLKQKKESDTRESSRS